VTNCTGYTGGQGASRAMIMEDPPVSAEFSLFPTGELGIRRIMRAAISPRWHHAPRSGDRTLRASVRVLCAMA
jgi:hypothetical protein